MPLRFRLAFLRAETAFYSLEITVSVEVEFPQLFEAVEGVRSQAANVVLRQRQMLHRDRNVIRDLSQSSSIAQHLKLFV